MSETPKRSEFLAASTALRKISGYLETRRKDVDAEIAYFKTAEDALAILADADKLRDDLTAEIASSRQILSGLISKTEKAREEFEATSSSLRQQADEAKARTESFLAAELERQQSVVTRIRELEERLSDAEKVAAEKLAALDTQVVEKTAVLIEIRNTIAKLAQM